MAEALPFANVVRILSTDMKAARGAGLLCSRRHVVTTSDALEDASEVFLDFPVIAPGKPMAGKVMRLRAKEEYEKKAAKTGRYIAVIELQDDPPTDVQPQRWARASDHVGSEIEVFALPLDLTDGVRGKGRLAEIWRAGQFRIHVEEPFHPELAGGAVWHPGRGVFIGLLLAGVFTEVVGISADMLSEAISELGLPAPKIEGVETEAAEDDPLFERLLSRRLAVSTLATNDLESAHALLDGPDSWGLGPEIGPGDIVLIYFPKTLAKDRNLQDSGPQSWGLRFLLRAYAESQPAGPNDNFRQLVKISEQLELPEPLDPHNFTSPPLADWVLAKQYFRRAGQATEPLSQDLARALWTAILEKKSRP